MKSQKRVERVEIICTIIRLGQAALIACSNFPQRNILTEGLRFNHDGAAFIFSIERFHMEE